MSGDERTPSDRRAVTDVYVTAPPRSVILPTKALTDGSSPPTVVDTWPLTYAFRPVRVPLPLDAITGRRVRQYHHVVAVQIALVPIGLAAICSTLAYALVSLPRPGPIMALAAIVPLFGALQIVTSSLAYALKPKQYPRLRARRVVLISEVSRPIAEEWIRMNPPGTITLDEPLTP